MTVYVRRRFCEKAGLPKSFALEASIVSARTLAAALEERDHMAPTGVSEFHALASVNDLNRSLIPAGSFESSLFEFAPQELAGAAESLSRHFTWVPPPEGEGTAYNHSHLLVELLVIWLANRNPAAEPLLELFDERSLSHDSQYDAVTRTLCDLLERQPTGVSGQSLLDILNAPIQSSPSSLAGQVRYLLDTRQPAALEPSKKANSLSARRRQVALRSLDLSREGTPRPKPAKDARPVSEIPDFHGSPETHALAQPARLAESARPLGSNWQQNLVLQCKQTHVWLVQLSEKHQREIKRLDQIPGEELDQLASRGFTGLWLIGVWERSEASQTIKRLRGNSEALGSAYALFDYQVASDLGGQEALDALQRRARRHGIRLMADVVPNHMAIDSPWLTERPECFLSVDAPPFTGYRFQGPDLSRDSSFDLHLEAGYYDESDAAVTFRLLDRDSGRARYVFHGNDGTDTPWNDTAQLDYLNPKTRQAMLDTMVKVARSFPIIRLDAAMTLTRYHYQRLWYPEPGDGGAIPGRSQHGLDRALFEGHMPHEFWREAIEHIEREAPDTLLVAEAFWLTEETFLRELQMHRVYDSAFMNLMAEGDAGKYQQLLRRITALDPSLLGRLVRYLSNPDEPPSVETFGQGDRYFALCTLLATLPGLPLWAHGQTEGLSERYGMEYARPYSSEKPDLDTVARHEREIFPLLAQRERFANPTEFRLFPFRQEQGINQEVFAFTCRSALEILKSTLVLVNCSDRKVHGRIEISDPTPRSDGTKKPTRLAAALGVPESKDTTVAFRDLRSGLRALARSSSSELRRTGLAVELEPHQSLVLEPETTP